MQFHVAVMSNSANRNILASRQDIDWPMPPPLWPPNFQQRMWKKRWDCPFWRIFIISSYHLQISILPWWQNPQAGIFCPPGKRNKAVASHPSGHLNANRDCGKSGEIDDFLLVFFFLSLLQIPKQSFHYKFFPFLIFQLSEGGPLHNKPFHTVFCALGKTFFSGFI